MGEETFFCRFCGKQYPSEKAHGYHGDRSYLFREYYHFKKPHYCQYCEFILHKDVLFTYCIDCGVSVARKLVTDKNGLIYLRQPNARCDVCQTNANRYVPKARKCVICGVELIGHSYKYCPNHKIVVRADKKAPKVRVPKIEVYTDLQWPFAKIHGKNLPDYMILINNSVPVGIPRNIRDDICQDIVSDYLDGKLNLDDLGKAVKKYTTSQYQMDRPYREISLDTPIHGYDGLTIGDTIDSERFHF